MTKFYTEHDRHIPQTPEEPFPTPGYLPVSVIMISVADPITGIPNIMPAVGWGWLNRDPMLVGVAVNTKDYNNDYYPRGTHPLLKKTMDFALNIPSEDLRDKITENGRLSRHKDPTVDKFRETGLTPGPGRRIKSPHIVECPISYECVMHAIYNMGSHDLFLGEVVGCFTEGEVIECETVEGCDHITMKREDGSNVTYEWQTLIKRSEKWK
ncbi:flavin reductase family protein [Candidatus Latescibacterota bacterium]